MIKIRKANKQDFEEFFELEEEFMEYNNKNEKIKYFKYKLEKSKIKKNFLKKIKDKNYLCLFLEDNKKAIGFLIGEIESFRKYGYIYSAEKIGYLENIFIKEQYRGKRYVKLLFNELLKYFKKNKIKISTLHVDSLNLSAIKAYKKLGYKGPIQYKYYKEI